MSLLIVGCGYVGSRIAKRWLDEGLTVYAMTRTSVRGQELKQLGIQPIVGHWIGDKPFSMQELPKIRHIVVAVPHREDLGRGEFTHQEGLRNLLRILPPGWEKLVYLSTTGVYGESNCEMVDENTLAVPTRIAGEIALHGEKWLAEQLNANRHCTLRLAGIYGPGRLPLIETLRQRQPLAVPSEGLLNLIHVDDAVSAVTLMLREKSSRSCYVLSDGHPVERKQFYSTLADLCGANQPTFIQHDAELSRGRRSASNKRINPRRFFQDFDFSPFFSTYRQGLEQCLAASDEGGG